MKKLLFFAASMVLSAALSAQIFTKDFTPDNVEGKIFVMKNKQTGLNISAGAGVRMYGGQPADYEKWAFFHLGTDAEKRDYYAIANYGWGQTLEVLGKQPPNGNALECSNWNKDWAGEDAVWYVEKVGDHYKIRTLYNNAAVSGLVGPFGYIALDMSNSEQPILEWELTEVGSLKSPPETKKATENVVIGTKPNWNSPLAPKAGEFGDWIKVGSSLVPFFMVKDDNLPLNQRIKESPYYKIERLQRWKHIKRQTNCRSGETKFVQTFEEGWSKENSSSFTTTTGISLTVGASGGVGPVVELSVSATVSTELSWQWSKSTTQSTSKSEQLDFAIPPYKILHLWQTAEKFVLTRSNGVKVKDWEIGVEETESTEVSCN
jgi:hypothetical protein